MSTFRAKRWAAAGILALGLCGAGALPALAHHVVTDCDDDGDRCVRLLCDEDEDDCRPLPPRHVYSDRVWICDEDGDDCHWAAAPYAGGPRWHPHMRPVEPGAFFGFRWHS